ncbi:transcriptional regulator [Photobacterium jeanii]|uniref:Transcriptional regulator n=1 Tax=Photobacterium jeanii TaxID=858640 RepID=A0A178KMS3_9GAMM|nr:HTH-type transcriptional regulator YidZ [Photobacterium jeanii]OAN18541.1 transcriptional regulator [Photobacterium jeanii]PST91777.1 HTH-type transcriptional regulator YidZ [Photobacterium jeanii]
MAKPLHRLDLNLLITMQTLLQERSVTRTAKKLNLTPSAVSKSLAKLRDWFDDPLFVRAPNGLQPTQLSLSMEQELGELFILASQIAQRNGTTTPSGLTFQLMLESPFHHIYFAELGQTIRQHYPDSQVRIRNWQSHSLDSIVNGDSDIGFCGRETHQRSQETLDELPYYIDHEVIYEDKPVVFIRDDHPLLSQAWTLDALVKHEFISILWEESEQFAFDELLASKGITRRVSFTLSDFEQSLLMTAQPHHQQITTAPSSILPYVRERFPNLVMRPLPLSDEEYQQLTIQYSLLWHKRNGHNPKTQWLRQTIRQLYQEKQPKYAPQIQKKTP